MHYTFLVARFCYETPQYLFFARPCLRRVRNWEFEAVVAVKLLFFGGSGLMILKH